MIVLPQIDWPAQARRVTGQAEDSVDNPFCCCCGMFALTVQHNAKRLILAMFDGNFDNESILLHCWSGACETRQDRWLKMGDYHSLYVPQDNVDTTKKQEQPYWRRCQNQTVLSFSTF